MLWTIVLIIIILWLLGLIGHIGGNFINILLVAAAIIIIYNFLKNRG